MPSAKPPRRSAAASEAPIAAERPGSKRKAASVSYDDDAYSEGGVSGVKTGNVSRATSVYGDAVAQASKDTEQLSYLYTPLPFKSASFNLYKARLPHPHPPSASSSTPSSTNPPLPGLTKTKKTAKQILAMEAYRGLSSAMLEEIKDRNEKKNKNKNGGGGIANLRGRPKAGAAKGGLTHAAMLARVEMETDSVMGGSAKSSVKGDEGSEEMDIEPDEEEIGVGVVRPTTVSPGEAPKRDVITYLTPQAPPSLLPLKKYCDITGLPARYTDPRTRLQYRGLEVWDVIRGLGPGVDQAYLGIRGAERRLV